METLKLHTVATSPHLVEYRSHTVVHAAAVTSRPRNHPGPGWIGLEACASATNEFVYDAQAQEVRLVHSSERHPRRARRWVGVVLALVASAFYLGAMQAVAQPTSMTASR